MPDKKNNPVFRISAAVVKQLGEELVSDELTAIMELVKNSYDADADWVKITINTKSKPTENDLHFKNVKGYIIIEDNGVGMDYSDIIDRWLFISISHKREMKRKGEVTKKGRTPLGDKGLGRLSTQRLGDVLEMYTGKESIQDQHHVAFDWRHFTENNSLESVETNYVKTVKPIQNKGTKLIISDLRNPGIWSGKERDQFRGQLSKLIFPFKEKRPFKIYLEIDGQPTDLDAINDKLREQAISAYKINFNGEKLTISGTLKLSKLQGNSSEKKDIFSKLIQVDNGANFFNFLTDKAINKKYFIPDVEYSGENGVFINFKREFSLEKDIKTSNIINEETGELTPANPGEFIGEIDEFNLSGTEEIETAYDSLSEYKQLVKNQVGVRVFRDGFGIKPYGMEDNDWLRLSKSQTSGGSFYLLRPENVIGFVSITAKNNKYLTEKTDREGFLDTPYSKNFFNIVYQAIQNINDVLEKTRRSYDIFKSNDAQSKGEIKSFKDTKDRLIATAKQSQDIENEVQSVQKEHKFVSEKLRKEVERIKKEPLFSSEEENKALKILKEVSKTLAESTRIFEKINIVLQNAKKLENDANYLEPKILELENQIIQFSELAGLGITAEAFTHEVYNIIDRIAAQTDQIAKQIKKDGNSDSAYFVYLEHVKSFIKNIRIQLNHLSPSLKFNRETKQEITLSTFISELKDYYTTRLGNGIQFNTEIIGDFTIKANKGKLIQVIDNIILNSEYWLKQKLIKDNRFKASINVQIKSPSIIIWDNGFGIMPNYESIIFQPFVTSKPVGEGRGLGLFIVQQLLDTMDSGIILLQKRNEHDRRYIFQINLDNLK